MTTDRDLERLLNEWFGEGPSEVSDRVFGQVIDRIDRQSQRPAWRFRWRDPQVNLNLRWAAAAAVLVVAIFAGARVLGPTPNSGSGGTSPTPSSSAAPTPSRVPGFVDASAFGVPLTLTLSGGWTQAVIEPNNLELLHGDTDLGFHPLSKVTLPGATTTDPWITVPADFIAWVQDRPEFTDFQAPRPVTVGGRVGTEIDAAFVWETGTTKRDFLRFTSGAWLYDEGNVGHRIRFIIVPGTASDGFLIVVNAPGADFDAATTALDVVLATVEFHAPTAYQTRSFEVPFGLTLVAGWTTGPETTGNLELRHVDLNLDPGIESIASLRAPSAPGLAPEPWPTDFRAWLANQPEFTPGPPVNVTVGGRPGTQVDVDASLSATDAPRIVMTGEGFDWKTVATPERWRFIVVETAPGAGIVIVMPAAPGEFVAAAAALDQLLATLVFR